MGVGLSTCITSGARTSRWTRMRLSHGRCSRQRAAGSFKSPTSAASSTTTNAAPPDHCSRRCRTGTTGLLTGHRPGTPLCPRRCQLAPSDSQAACRQTLIAGRRRLLRAPTEFLVGTGVPPTTSYTTIFWSSASAGFSHNTRSSTSWEQGHLRFQPPSACQRTTLAPAGVLAKYTSFAYTNNQRPRRDGARGLQPSVQPSVALSKAGHAMLGQASVAPRFEPMRIPDAKLGEKRSSLNDNLL
jgi:hypothetical protein